MKHNMHLTKKRDLMNLYEILDNGIEPDKVSVKGLNLALDFYPGIFKEFSDRTGRGAPGRGD